MDAYEGVYTWRASIRTLGNPCRLSSLYGETPIDEDSCCRLSSLDGEILRLMKIPAAGAN